MKRRTKWWIGGALALSALGALGWWLWRRNTAAGWAPTQSLPSSSRSSARPATSRTSAGPSTAEAVSRAQLTTIEGLLGLIRRARAAVEAKRDRGGVLSEAQRYRLTDLELRASIAERQALDLRVRAASADEPAAVQQALNGLTAFVNAVVAETQAATGLRVVA